VTGHDVRYESELKEKLEELKIKLRKENIELEYSFDPNLHDRWIDVDTGWKIILGRGLDIFQKPDSQFSLGFLDQTKKKKVQGDEYNVYKKLIRLRPMPNLSFHSDWCFAAAQHQPVNSLLAI